MNPLNSVSYVRRAQVVSLSLTELMLLLVFMAIAFSFLAKQEGLKEVPLIQVQLNEARAKNRKLIDENTRLAIEIASANKELARLRNFLREIGIDSGTLRPTGNVIKFPSGGPTFVLNTTSGKAPGRPLCALHGVFLISFSLLPGKQIQGAPAWDQAVDRAVSGLAGLHTLSSEAPLSFSEFQVAARQLKNDALLRRSGCVFAVKATRKTNDADVFDAELSLVEQYFYVRHN